jgi:hypothetical protein
MIPALFFFSSFLVTMYGRALRLSTGSGRTDACYDLAAGVFWFGPKSPCCFQMCYGTHEVEERSRLPGLLDKPGTQQSTTTAMPSFGWALQKQIRFDGWNSSMVTGKRPRGNGTPESLLWAVKGIKRRLGTNPQPCFCMDHTSHGEGLNVIRANARK